MKGWKDITLRMAIEIDQLGEMDEIDLTINQMAIIRDTTIDEIEKLNPSELIEFVKEYDFMSTFPEPKEIKIFKKDHFIFFNKKYQNFNVCRVQN